MSDDDRDIDVDSDVSNRGDTFRSAVRFIHSSVTWINIGPLVDACFVFHNATISRKVTIPILGKPLRDRPVGASIFHRFVLCKFLETKTIQHQV